MKTGVKTGVKKGVNGIKLISIDACEDGCEYPNPNPKAPKDILGSVPCACVLVSPLYYTQSVNTGVKTASKVELSHE